MFIQIIILTYYYDYAIIYEGIDILCGPPAKECIMSNITTGFFFQPFEVTENEPLERGAMLTYSIGLLEAPEIMERCQSKSGFYMNQLGFELVSLDGSTIDGPGNDPYNLEVAIFGNVNPGYNAALSSLFGVEIGQILTQTGEVYERAMGNQWDKVDNEVGYKYIGGISMVEQLVIERQSLELAEQVFHRLMANSVFL